MESIEYGLVAICLVSGVCYFISTFIYLPFYMLLLKLREPDMYKELDGISVFIPISFFLAPIFFCNKKYRESSNKWVVFHGEILRWAQGYMAFLMFFSVILYGLLFYITH